MPTPVVMPQMGESIAEGTIVRWIKKVGDTVDRDEPLFEISTDKVDAEIPSPVGGILTEIKVKEGETVAVNSVVATIGQEGAEPAAEPANPARGPAASAPAGHAPGDGQDGQSTGAAASASRATLPGEAPPVATQPVPLPTGDSKQGAAARTGPAGLDARPEASRDELRRRKSSPLVRRIASEHHVDISRIPGTGLGGRVTKHDILEHLEHPDRGAATPSAKAPASPSEGRVEIQPLSVMRKKIAEHMILSRRTSAHVHSVFHVNFSTVDRIRQKKKEEYEQQGTRLTYMSFIGKAVIDALKRHPIVNASLDGDNVVYKKDINLGIAVALEGGLIVPVIRNADEKNVLGLSRAIEDVATRARARQLQPDEVHGGTFTITNPGQSGAQFGMPIINQPQVAILGVGTIEKRPIVIDDAIAIRMMAYLTLGFDHRLIDGAVADQFMADVKAYLEGFDPDQV